MNGGTLTRALRKARKICKKYNNCDACPFGFTVLNKTVDGAIVSFSGCKMHIGPDRLTNEEIKEFIESLKVALSYDLSSNVQNKPK